MIEWANVLVDMVIRGFSNNSTLIVPVLNDAPTWLQTLMSSTISSGFAVLLGGGITLYASHLQDKRRYETEKINKSEEEKSRRLQLCIESYIEILNKLPRLVVEMRPPNRDPEFLAASAKVFAFGDRIVKEELYIIVNIEFTPENWPTFREHLETLRLKITNALMYNSRTYALGGIFLYCIVYIKAKK